MKHEFRVDRGGGRVVFGVDSSRTLADELAAFGANKALFITTPRQRATVEALAATLGDRSAGVYTNTVQHVPVATAEAARAEAKRVGADWIIAYGGGSAIGLGKAVALSEDVRLGVIATTYSGSEMTPIWGMTEGDRKTTGRDERVRPKLVIYDPALTLDLPVAISMTSMFNAMAHAVEAMYAPDVDPVTLMMAEESIRLLARALPSLAERPRDIEARSHALYGAHLAGSCLGSAGVALHHKLCHVLGGSFGMPHSQTHTAVLPHSIAYNHDAAPTAMARIADALGVSDPAAGVFDLIVQVGAPVSLRELGFASEDIDKAADIAMETPYQNPRELERDAIREVIADAHHGRRPSQATRRTFLTNVTGPHSGVSVSLRGAQLERARGAVLCVHGRGATAESILTTVEQIVGGVPGLALVAPQALDNSWYAHPFTAQLDDNRPHLDSAHSTLAAVLELIEGYVPREKILIVGFSQGGCLALDFAAQLGGRFGGVAGLSAGLIGPDDSLQRYQSQLSGTPVLLGCSRDDKWIPRGRVRASAEVLTRLGALVTERIYEGSDHVINDDEVRHVRRMAERLNFNPNKDELQYLSGFGGALASEALPGALPKKQNSPRRAAYGLYPEQLNGTPFTARRAHSRRSWLYRIRPQVLQSDFDPIPRDMHLIRGSFGDAHITPNLIRWNALALPHPDRKVDFIDGLATFGGCGSTELRSGLAIHLYSANADMVDRCFYNSDGDMLIVPENGALYIQTEFGRLQVVPGEVVVIGRGMKFSIDLPTGVGRGFVLEVFNNHFALPDRGPIGANGLADERHFLAPSASYDDRACPGYEVINKFGGELFKATLEHSPYDVVAWHGNYVPFKYDLALYNAMGSVSFDHADPSIYTVLTCPLDHGSAVADFIVFKGRWDVGEHTFRPPYFHRNIASEFSAVIRSDGSEAFEKGGYFMTPVMTPHGVGADVFDKHTGRSEAEAESPRRLSDDSLWVMFESSLSIRLTDWALNSPNRDENYRQTWGGLRSHFDPERRDPWPKS